MSQLCLPPEIRNIFLSFLSTTEENIEQWPHTSLQVCRGDWTLRLTEEKITDPRAVGAIEVFFQGTLHVMAIDYGVEEEAAMLLIFSACYPTMLGAIRALEGYLQSCPFTEP